MTSVFSILSQALPIRWQAPWLLPAMLLLGAALTAAVLWFYPGQVKLVRRPWRYIIPTLRLLAFTALAVSIARPVALRARPPEDRGALIVLVDRSASMSIADASRKPAELVALADAMGLLPAGTRAAATASITAEFEQIQAAVGQAIRAQGDLDYARVSGRGIEAAEARVRKGVDDARELGRALAARLATLSPDTGPANPAKPADTLQDKIAPLADLPVADLRGGWIAETRRRLDQASAAMTRFQDIADKRLYDTNADVWLVCQELEKRTRAELAAEILVRPGGLLSRLGPETQVMLFGFADSATPIPAVGPAPAAATLPSPAPPEDSFDTGAIGPDTPPVVWTSPLLPLTANGSGTDIAGALAQALTATEGKPIRGVLVISDGQQVGGEATSAAAAMLRPGVPLIAVSATGLLAPKDISVVDVSVPPAAFAGETVAVRARIRGAGGAVPDSSTARLAIQSDFANELQPASVTKTAGRKDESSAEFAVKLEHPGVAEIAVSVPTIEGEAAVSNNTVRRWVKVLPEKLRVAAYAGSAGWDFQYLRSALSRRNWFSVQSAVLDPTASKFPLTPDQILRQDVLVLYDMPVTALDRDQWYAVDRLVTQRGGSVVFIAGPGFNPASYIEQPLASALLPFNLQSEKKPVWRQWPGDRPSIQLLPGAQFARSDLLRLSDDDLLNRRWQDLPGVWRTLPVRVARPGVQTLLRDAETGQAVVTEMKSGAGRAIYVGTHETWRWRLKSGEAEQERFWRQLIRHSAEEPYTAQGGGFALDLDRVSVPPGAPVQARVRPVVQESHTQSIEGSEIAPESLQLEVWDAAVASATPIRRYKLTDAADGSSRFRATLGDLPAGRFAVRLSSTTQPTNPKWPEVMLRVEPSNEAEMRNLAGDPDRLRRMAESTGGRLIRMDQIAAVPGLLAAAADDRPRVVEWSLWDSPWLFAFVVGCLGAEWALRKRAGLA